MIEKLRSMDSRADNREVYEKELFKLGLLIEIKAEQELK